MSLSTLLHRRTTPEPVDGEPVPAAESAGLSPIGEVRWRQPVRVAGQVRSVRVQPRANVPTLECTVVDASGGITVVFLGRRSVPGIRLGSRMILEGRAGAHHGKLALLNPEYTLLSS
jgi:RecG-like helicase